MKNNCVIIKDVVGYEGLYKITSDGNIISLGNGNSTNSETKKVKQMTIFITDKGYTKIKLSKNSVIKYYSIHRLVAKAFIPNPENKLQVNHINGKKTDNRVENLEWVTAKENIQHSVKNGLQVYKKGIENKCSKQIFQKDLQGNIIKEWGSINEACKQLNYNSFGIIKCCKNQKKYKTAYGYKWEYKNV